ncbi:rhomboid family intramembrane serine protease [Phenylobacterium sp.]|uniref:rhomboid family intramembrane serine protease n=1 Tax=Phenylobacterium sp. TaxID=1871053 RepID=UPI002F9583D0
MSVSFFEERADRPGPWNAGPDPQWEAPRPAREPVFNNGAWYVLLMVAVVVGGYALQSRLPPGLVAAFYFVPADLLHGRWETALTAVFLHGNWTHALFNAAFLLAFGTPVARMLGLGLRGALAFLGFYVLTGVLANLAFAAVHWGSEIAVVGASGAVSALMAAAARVMAGRGRLGPVFARFVLTMGAAWVLVNALIAVVLAQLGNEILPGTGGAGVAWEAHIAGFVLGALLISPFAWLAGRR